MLLNGGHIVIEGRFFIESLLLRVDRLSDVHRGLSVGEKCKF